MKLKDLELNQVVYGQDGKPRFVKEITENIVILGGEDTIFIILSDELPFEVAKNMDYSKDGDLHLFTQKEDFIRKEFKPNSNTPLTNEEIERIRKS
jgi:hypothetical protein